MMKPWEKFYNDKIRKILNEKKTVIDIGGGLRIIKEKNNRYEQNNEWVRPLLEKVDYKIMDPVSDYNPDIIGDIQNLPFDDGSQDAIICLAVLEHVENPIKGWNEIYRTLKSGGYAFIYVPFLYYYHAEEGYYKDYWRFSKDTITFLSKPFKNAEIQTVRGAIGTWVRLGPLGRFRIFESLAYILDYFFGKLASAQVSGYYVFLMR